VCYTYWYTDVEECIVAVRLAPWIVDHLATVNGKKLIMNRMHQKFHRIQSVCVD
jgi:hypothetical protein